MCKPWFDHYAQAPFDETSECALGLPAQPSDTCPLIDELIDLLGAPGIRTDLCEAIRGRAMDLRAWGQAWKEHCLDRIERCDPDTHTRIVTVRRDREVRAIIEGFAENLRC